MKLSMRRSAMSASGAKRTSRGHANRSLVTRSDTLQASIAAVRKVAVELRPDLNVPSATGYTRNAVVHNGVLDPGVNFIAKPFAFDQLGQKIREVLS
jgi:hypothetical protein